MQITKAGRDYLATQYEQAVDRGLDVDTMRVHLASIGIPRTPAQLRHDLDVTYAFAGYWASHPAPPPPDVLALDKAIDQMTNKQLKLHDLAAPAQPDPARQRHIVRVAARRHAA